MGMDNNDSMQVSVIICTYNRSDSFVKTLKSFEKIVQKEDVLWELIIVDNNSSDNTREVVSQFIQSSDFPCKYIFEKNQGLSHARNRGITEARGKIIAFTDDDIEVDKNWLYNIYSAFKDNNVACMGGKILPVWEKPCPRWLTRELFGYLALLDLGDEKKQLKEPTIWGANIAIKSSMFHQYGIFDTELGHSKGKLYGGEETKFVKKMLEGGEDVFYIPDAIVHHHIPTKRMKKSYFRKWRFDNAELKGIQMGKNVNRNILGIPLYILRGTVFQIFRFIYIQIFKSDNAFIEQLKLFDCLGTISGRLKYRNMAYD